jgi:membrane carboxypeptidase/penicillin-binding protein
LAILAILAIFLISVFSAPRAVACCNRDCPTTVLPYNSARRLGGQELRTTLKKLVAAFLVLVLTAIGVQYFVAFIRTPGIVARAEQSGGLMLSEFRGQRLQWLLQVQDPAFHQHHGVDLGTPGAGYTTITEALTKALFFHYSFQPGFLRWRKIQQVIIAMAVDARVPKERQLRLFVNLAYMGTVNGRPITGLSQAARQYFVKDFQNLTDDEYLALVAAMVAPERYSSATHPAENQRRVVRIRRMLAGLCKPSGHADVEYSACAE